MRKKFVYGLIGASIGAVFSLGIQTYAGDVQQVKSTSIPVKEIKTFAEVYGQIKTNYFEDTKDKDLIENAMKGMVSGLDPHSEYLNQEDLKDFSELATGKFGGLGLEIVKDNDFISIITPIEDTPAFAAGLRPNDHIIQIDGVSTRGMSTIEASKKMRGGAGTSVVLTIARKDVMRPFNVKLQRAIINVKTVKSRYFEPGIGYIRLSGFKEQTLSDFADHIRTLSKEHPLKGLILDLRNNAGGLLNSAVGVVSAFVPKNAIVVSTKGRRDTQKIILKARKSDYQDPSSVMIQEDPLAQLPEQIKKIPLTILINAGSASASEVVTGALQDYQRALVMGTRSFGKGSVQTVIPLSSDDGIKLTIALYFTPKGRSIQARGIVPDVEVKTKDDDLFDFRETSLSHHLSNPSSSKTEQPMVVHPTKSPQPINEKENERIKNKLLKEGSYNYIPDPKQDIQLRKAIEFTSHSGLWKKSLGRYIVNEKKIIAEERKTGKVTTLSGTQEKLNDAKKR